MTVNFEQSWQTLISLLGARGQLETMVWNQAMSTDSTDIHWEADLKSWENAELLPPVENLVYPWLCMALVFRLSLNEDIEHSKTIKGILKGKQWTTIFYQFQRPFFTRFESELDRHILRAAFQVEILASTNKDIIEIGEAFTGGQPGTAAEQEREDPAACYKKTPQPVKNNTL
jgi:hypothetical protein